MVEAMSMRRRRRAYDRRKDISDDEHIRKWEPAEDGEWQEPAADWRFRDLRAPAPNDRAPAHEIAEYRGRG
jgi:hypothetical protein